IMFGKSPLKRKQREMMAVVVSKANDCEYCQTHHSAALRHYWKDDEKVQQLKDNYKELELETVDKRLCDLAWELTVNPSGIDEDKFLDPLRKENLNDRAILDATLVISYFNFVNRMVLGLGLEVEEDGGEGYEY
ncbi:MAG: carboxymuconolactone decarboxylase family protein, partial [Flavobacteriales bacterium]